MRNSILALSIICAATAVPVSAQDVEYPSAVSTFNDVCLTGAFDPAMKIAVLEAKGWTKDAAVTVDIPKLEISRAIEKNYRFKKIESSEQWSGTIDGAPARFVFASFPEKERYPHLCALVMEGAKNAIPYGTELKEDFKQFGIKGKSVDLVHYYEFAGKVGAEKHPARGEIFTRSQAGQAKETMHIYLAY